MTKKVCIELTTGDKINIELYPDIAPITVANFEKLVSEKFYDGLIFHRIIKDFMVQGGGYYIENNTIKHKDAQTIKGEFANNGWTKNTLLHTAGVISMARATPYDSASSQFFLMTGTSPHLDGDYAAFGKACDEQSLKVIMKLNVVKTGYLGAGFETFPVDLVAIKTITFIK